MMNIETVDHLLTTTRAVRKRLDLDRPVDLKVVHECLGLALQAPSGSNLQGWRFMVITDPDNRHKLGQLYRKAFQVYASQQKPLPSDDPRAGRQPAVVRSAVYLAENLSRVPVLILGCVEGRFENEGVLSQASHYGSILPAMWSLQLALRSRGLGSAWTTLHLMHEREAADILGIPTDFTQACLLPVAYFQGEDFKPAKRLPVEQVTYHDGWGQPFRF